MPPNSPGLDMQAASLVQPISDKPDLPDAITGLLMDPAGSRYLETQLVQVLDQFLAPFFGRGVGSAEIVEAFVREFLPEHRRFDFPQAGSTGLGGLLIVYLLARKLQPAIIVESGTFVGASLHALRQGWPGADLWSFDVSFKPLRYRENTIRYCEHDWTLETEPRAKSDHDFVFFDDHIDNAKRIVEAHERGFRYLLFDDAPTVGQIAAYRFPGVPTVPMIIDPQLPRISISWVHQDTWLRYDHDPERCRQARELVDLAVPVPNLRPSCGLHAGDKWLVRLK
jgi:hypothetical protein